ncbi:MAG: PilZ domain-containing protein [Rhodospirillaceae bacterium]
MSFRKLAGYKDNNKRRDVRLDARGMRLVIGSGDFPVGDISVGGFSLQKAVGKMRTGQKFTATHVITDVDGKVPLGAPTEVARVDYAETSLGCQFGKLTDGQFRMIEALAMHRPMTSLGRLAKKMKGFFGLFGGS